MIQHCSCCDCLFVMWDKTKIVIVSPLQTILCVWCNTYQARASAEVGGGGTERARPPTDCWSLGSSLRDKGRMAQKVNAERPKKPNESSIRSSHPRCQKPTRHLDRIHVVNAWLTQKQFFSLDEDLELCVICWPQSELESINLNGLNC